MGRAARELDVVIDLLEITLDSVAGYREAAALSDNAGLQQLFLRRARELTAKHGALLIVDEVQTGVGRTGSWFAFQQAGIVPDAMTLAKGLGGGVPIGALVTFGADVSGLLTVGQHGSTFGGNPLAAAAGFAVLEAIESEGLLAHAREVGDHLCARVEALGHPLVSGVRGAARAPGART